MARTRIAINGFGRIGSLQGRGCLLAWLGLDEQVNCNLQVFAACDIGGFSSVAFNDHGHQFLDVRVFLLNIRLLGL